MWGIAGTSELGIATKKGLLTAFMPSAGLISKPHKAAHVFVHPRVELTHEWGSPARTLAPLHTHPSVISQPGCIVRITLSGHKLDGTGSCHFALCSPFSREKNNPEPR